jgi:hypothetical protein
VRSRQVAREMEDHQALERPAHEGSGSSYQCILA